MNKRMFAASLKRITRGKGENAMIWPSLIYTELTPEECDKIVKFLVRNRGPILLQFVEQAHKTYVDPASMDAWLRSCGYLHATTGRGGYQFVHTSEHHIKQ